MKIEVREEKYTTKTPRLKFEGGSKILTIIINKEVNKNTLFVR